MSLHGNTGCPIALPFKSYWANAFNPTLPTFLVADENLEAMAVKAAPLAPSRWFVKSLPKKFQVSTPFTPNIATKLAEGFPSIKNFSAIPGVKLLKASDALVFF